MSPAALLVCGRLLLLVSATIQLVRSSPAWSSKEYPDSPDYLTLQDPAKADDYKRAPWAPSLPRSDSFSQKVREIISERNNKGKRGKHSERLLELGELSDDEVTNLFKFLQSGIQGLDYEAMDFALKAINERSKSTAERVSDLGRSPPVGKERLGSKGEPIVYQLDGDFKQPKRSSPFNLGLGQHAASAAMSAYENILDDERNLKADRPSSPVRFLGKR